MKEDRIVQRIYSRIDEIPTLSPILQKIISTVEDSSADARDLTDIITNDISLTSKILKVSNSAYYGFQHKIGSLDRAVVLLGFNMIKSLAMSVGIIKTLPAQSKGSYFSRERLWIHSLAVATVMKHMAETTGRKEEGDALFVAGLLHDIGKVVLDQFFSEEYHQILEETGCLESASVCEAEIKHFGMDHGDVGNILLKRWNFPSGICDLVAMDHKSDVPEKVNDADVAMLHIADILSKEVGMGVSESITSTEIPESDLAALGLDKSGLDSFREYLTEAKDGIYSFYSSLG